MSRGSAGGTFEMSPNWTSFVDSLDPTIISVNGTSVVRHNALGSLRLRTAAECSAVYVRLISNQNRSNAKGAWAVWIDGVFRGTINTPSTTYIAAGSSEIAVCRIDVDPSAAHTIELYSGNIEGGSYGTWITQVWGAGPNPSILLNPTAAKRMVIYGDSITVGYGATTPSTEGWVPLLRQQNPTWRFSTEAWGGRQLYDDTGSGVAAITSRLVALTFSASTARAIALLIGYNDWANATMTAATFATLLGQLCDAIHAADSGIKIIAQTLFPCGNEAGVNGRGEGISAFRSAATSVANARPSFVQLVDASGWAIQLADSAHPGTLGNTQISALYTPIIAGL
jgi:lysophospholipase L1-like esterase